MKKLLALATMISFIIPCRGMDGDKELKEAVALVTQNVNAACMNYFRQAVGNKQSHQRVPKELDECRAQKKRFKLLTEMATEGDTDAQAVILQTAAMLTSGKGVGQYHLSFPEGWQSEKTE